MRIALATFADLPDFEVDDRPLHEALERRGVTVTHPSWDDPGVDWPAHDACLIRSTWDYMERRDEYLAWTRRVAGVTSLFNDADTVAWNTHKSYLRDLAGRGVPVVPTVWLDRGDRADVGRLMAERGWPGGVLKPAVGATARETIRFPARDGGLAAAQAHLDRLLAAEDMLLQPYIPTVETFGEISAIFIDGALTHAARKVPKAGDYRVQHDFGASDEPIDLAPEQRDAARRAVEAVDADLLYARVDLLMDEDGRLLLNELELVEPLLFFRHGPAAADRLAAALCRRLG